MYQAAVFLHCHSKKRQNPRPRFELVSSTSQLYGKCICISGVPEDVTGYLNRADLQGVTYRTYLGTVRFSVTEAIFVMKILDTLVFQIEMLIIEYELIV